MKYNIKNNNTNLVDKNFSYDITIIKNNSLKNLSTKNE